MQITLGPQYNVGEKPTVILYIYINRHVGTRCAISVLCGASAARARFLDPEQTPIEDRALFNCSLSVSYYSIYYYCYLTLPTRYESRRGYKIDGTKSNQIGIRSKKTEGTAHRHEITNERSSICIYLPVQYLLFVQITAAADAVALKNYYIFPSTPSAHLFSQFDLRELKRHTSSTR